MNFKDYAQQDINTTFFNISEFAVEKVIDKMTRCIVIDEDKLKERVEKEFNGISSGMILYFASMTEFSDIKPKIGATQLFDNKLMYVVDVKLEDGIYEILITQNRSE